MELRCSNGILFGFLDTQGKIPVIEVKCRSRRCGHEPGAVVLHRFSVYTGDLLETKRFKDPAQETKGDRR